MSQRPWIDLVIERGARGLARRTSRRSLLARIGAAMVGAATFPLLPVARAADDSRVPPPSDEGLEPALGDPGQCSYWRHCAIDGFLCACCGGSATACPPGTEMSPVTWIGTCRNPTDGKDYIVSYNDCCGKSGCGRCLCNRNEGDRPVYMPSKSNDINWCHGTTNNVYHCSTAVVLELARAN
jgi:methylamine dehydrogenase light chain